MHALSADEDRFLEECGLFFERMGFPRIGGRILALMMIAEEPLSLEDIAKRLRVSKASVSTNARQFERVGFLDMVARLGDRRTYYQWSPRAFERRFEFGLAVSGAVARFAEMGLSCIHHDDTVARTRLEEAAAFASFMQEQMTRVQGLWGERRGRG